MHEKPTEEGLEIEFVNGQVVVVATAVGSRQMARDLTDKVNQPLTEAINASASLSKQSPESIFNEWLPSLWPSKYGEEAQGQPAQKKETNLGDVLKAAEESQDWASLPEGTVIVDEEDNSFSVNADGSLTQIGGASNAAIR